MEEYDFIVAESFEEYQQKSAKYLTAHQLADFRKCPMLYRKKEMGLISDEDRPAYLVGRAAHTLILEGRERLCTEYATGGPINARTGKPYGVNTQAYAEWVAAQGKPALTDEQAALISSMAAGVRAHGAAMDLLADGIPEGVIRTEYCGVPCQARIDWFHPVQGIVDLKTCDDLDWLEADARRYGYAHQLAFYRALLAHFINDTISAYIIAIEKREPFRCGVWQVSGQMLAACQRENEAAIERLKQCRASDLWPTGYEEIRIFNT